MRFQAGAATTPKATWWRSGLERVGVRSAGLLFILPALIVVASVVLIPTLYTLYLGLTKYNLVSPPPEWVGLDNFIRMLNSGVFWKVLGRTILLLLVTLNVELILGLGIALALARPFPGRRWVFATLLIPMMLPPVVVGFNLTWMLDEKFGAINGIFSAVGLDSLSQPWLAQTSTALPAVMAAEIWMNTSFMMLIAYAGLQGLPKSVFEAASLAGASRWRQFKDLILPMITPYLLIALIIRSVDLTNRIFDMIWIMTKGGPGLATEIIPTYVYKLALVDLNIGYASAVSYGALVVSVAFTAFLFWQLRRARGKLA